MVNETFHGERGDEAILADTNSAPDCCGQVMTAANDPCLHPMSAEAVRLSDADDACDDGIR